MNENTHVDPLATQAMQAASQSGGTTSTSASGSGRLEVRCPNCHSPSDIAADTPLTDLTCVSCGSHFSLVDQSKATRMAPPLSQMGRFELIERLGIGGFGSVWKARDKELDRTVAIKIPRAGGMTGEEQEKFFREARAAAQLRHPNIVSVHEVGRDGDSVYIVSDFVRGVTLGDWLTGQKLTNREAAELCARVADALDHAHDQGVIHRDLKPANIIIDGDGAPHLMDFGLARREVGEVTMTTDGQVLGTPAYMSPEQAQGEAHTADRRSDVYSLGVILFQLLTGELPFRGNARMLMHQVVNDEAPSPRKLNSHISKDLETITLKCLEKDPSRRYQSAAELGDELRRVLAGEPIFARPIGTAQRVVRWSRRSPLVAGLSAAAFSILCIGLVVSSTLGLEARRQSQAAIASQRRAEQALAKEQAATREAKQLRQQALNEKNEARKSFYFAQMMAIPEQLKQTRYDKARQMLSDAPAEYRAWEWGYFARLCNLDLGTFKDDRAATATAFSPDGSSFAAAGSSGLCTIYDWPTAQPRHALKTKGDGVTSLAFSPDGRLLVTGQSNAENAPGEATIWDVVSGEKLMSLAHDGGVKCVGFSRDGGLVATGGFDGTARIWDAHTGEQRHVFEKHKATLKSLAFSPALDILATADKGGDNVVKIYDQQSGALLTKLPPTAASIESMAFSPDGRLLAVGDSDGWVHFCDVSKWQYVRHTHVHTLVWALGFSPDGKYLACGCRNPIVPILTATPAKDSSLLTALFSPASLQWRPWKEMKGHGVYVNAVAFSRDGRVLLTGSSDQTSKLWDVHANNEVLELTGKSNGSTRDVWPHVKSIRFTPDGKSVAMGSVQDEYVRIWDVDTGKERMRLGPHEANVYSLDLSPDGRKLLVAARDSMRLWDLASGASQSLTIENNSAWADAVAYSPDGNLIAMAFDKRVVLWDCKSNRVAKSIDGHTGDVSQMRFSPDGTQLATITAAATAKVYVWDVNHPTKPLVEKVVRKQNTSNIAFSPDGSQLAVAAGNSPILLDPKSGDEIQHLIGNSDLVTGITFSPDGKRIATVSLSGLLIVWDAADGRELLNLGQIAPWLYCAEFSPDGSCLAAGGRSPSKQTAGIMLFKAFPWNHPALASGSEPSDIEFQERKRAELKRTLTGDKKLELIRYTIKDP